MRDFTADRARRAGVDPDRLPDLVLAVNELATNSLRHGGGRGVLRIWEQDGTSAARSTTAGGSTIRSRAASAPDHLADNGRGLWIVNHLCDLVQVRPGVVRMHVRIN